MGCNCGKKKAGVGSPAAARRVAATASPRRTPVRRVPSATARQMPTATAPRPANPLRYYVIAPDGTEERYNTLAEAQTVLRRHGYESGYKVESRRETA